MSSSFDLGTLEGDSARPFFRASANGVAFLVELDNSAMQKLAGRRGYDWREAIEAQRDRIRSAAQDLYEGGFASSEDMPRLFVTAIDIL